MQRKQKNVFIIARDCLISYIDNDVGIGIGIGIEGAILCYCVVLKCFSEMQNPSSFF